MSTKTLSDVDFSATKETLLKLELACVCASCEKLPSKDTPVLEVVHCGHFVCQDCGENGALKSCPAVLCDSKIAKKSLKVDEDMTRRWVLA